MSKSVLQPVLILCHFEQSARFDTRALRPVHRLPGLAGGWVVLDANLREGYNSRVELPEGFLNPYLLDVA